MVPPFDIFKRQGGGSVRWLGVTTDLEAAKLRVTELAESIPGEYFIFSLATGHRLDMKMTDANNGPSLDYSRFCWRKKKRCSKRLMNTGF
jgi:hypothetical protein